VALASVSYIFKAFIGKGGLAIKKLFKTARVKVNNIKGVNKYNLK
jgi:hypothetical protein